MKTAKVGQRIDILSVILYRYLIFDNLLTRFI